MKRQLEIPSAYFLSSTDDLVIEAELFRTEGSQQVQEWVEIGHESGLENAITYRRYFKGRIGERTFFAKEFLVSNAENWTIAESVRYQFENLLILIDLPFVPAPLFYTPTMLGFEFVEGRNIRQMVADGMASKLSENDFVARFTAHLQQIEDRLSGRGRRYDASFNNVLIGDDNSIHFIDFDFVPKSSWKHNLGDDVRRIASGEMPIKPDGQMQVSTRFTWRSSLRRLIKRFLR